MRKYLSVNSLGPWVRSRLNAQQSQGTIDALHLSRGKGALANSDHNFGAVECWSRSPYIRQLNLGRGPPKVKMLTFKAKMLTSFHGDFIQACAG